MKYQKLLQRLTMPRSLLFVLAAFLVLGLGSISPARAQTPGSTSVTNGCVVLTCPGDKTVFTCESFFTLRDYDATAVDTCTGGMVKVFCDPPPPTNFLPGPHTVKCEAVVGDKVVATCSFTIVVVVDTKPPVIECPADILVDICNRECGVVTYPTIVASDDTGLVAVTCDPPSGTCFPIGTKIVTCVAQDRCQRTTECTFKVVVSFSDANPTIQCPSSIDIKAPCGKECAVVNYPAPVVGAGVLVGCLPPSGTCFPIGTHTVLCTAKNDCGKEVKCEFQIRVAADPGGPVTITCPPDQIISTCNECEVVNYAAPTVTGGSLVGCIPPTGTCFPLGVTTVVCAASNECGAKAECKFTITVRPRPVATLQCPLEPLQAQAPCGKNCAFVNYPVPAVANGQLVGCNPPPTTCFPIGLSTVVCEAIDECGHVARCEFKIQVTADQTAPPVITCPPNITVFTCGNCENVTYPPPVVVGGQLASCSVPSGSCFPLGVTAVFCLATSECGLTSECKFTVTVRPKETELSIRCPDPITAAIGCGQNCATLNYPAPVVAGGVLVGCVPPSGSCFPVGVNPVVCTAKDDCGHDAKCTFTVTVVSDTALPPVIQCPANIVAETCGNCEIVNYPAPVITGGTLAGCSVPAGSCLPLGTTTVICIATSECGTTSECKFTITVRPKASELAIRCPEPINAAIACGQNCATVNYPPPVVVGGVLVGCVPPSGSCFPVGVNPVICTAKDDCSHEAKCTFTINVVTDNAIPPTIQCPADIVAETCGECEKVTYPAPVVTGGKLASCSVPSGTCFPIGSTAVFCIATNDCGGSAECRFTVTVRPRPVVTIKCPTEPIVVTSPCGQACRVVNYPAPLVANGALVACNPPSGTCFPVGSTSVVCVAKDECGRSATCEFKITVTPGDAVPPTIACPTNITVEACGLCQTVLFPAPVIVGGSLAGCQPPPGSCFPIGVSPVVCIATNDCGAKNVCTFTVTVRPKTSQLGIQCPEPITVTVPCGKECSIVNYPPPVVVNGVLVGCNPPSGTCFPLGVTSVACLAKDECGHLVTCAFPVRVLPDRGQPATIACPQNIAVETCGKCEIVSYPPPVVTGGTLVACFPPAGTCFPLGVNTVNCVATNECGIKSECVFTVTVRPKASQLVLQCPEIFTAIVGCDTNCVVVNYPAPAVAGGTLVGCTPPPGTCFTVGLNPVICVAKDDCGREAKCRFLIFVIRETANSPIIRCPKDLVAFARCGQDCAVVNYPPPVVGNGVLVGCTPPSGKCLPIGPTIVTCVATNRCGQSAECKFTITVRPDPAVLLIHCPRNLTLTIPCGKDCIPVNYPRPVVDNGTLVSCTPPPGTCLPPGVHTIVCVAKDECGHEVKCEFFIQVIQEPGTPPQIHCPENLAVVADCGKDCVPVNYPLPVVGNGVLVGCLPPPGFCFPLGPTIVTCTATNVCGGKAECRFLVTVRPTRPVAIHCPQEPIIVSLPCDENCVVVNYPLPPVVNGTLVSCSPPPGTCLPVGTFTVTCVAKDECGNQAGCEFRVVVIPTNEQPLAIRCPEDIVVNTCDTCAIVNYPPPVVINGVLVDCTPPSGSCFPPGVTKVLCRAVNACSDQTGECSFNVIVRPGAPCVRPPKNMVLWLPFDETIGALAHNLVAGAPNGFHFNGPVPLVGQKVDNSLGFDGQDDAVVVPNYAGIQFGRGNFSIDTWLFRRDDGGKRMIVSKAATGALGKAGFQYYLANGVMVLELHTPGGGVQVFNSEVVVPSDNQWHLVAVTVDRTGANPGAHFYLDGFQVAVVNAGIAGSVNNFARLYVGTGSLGFPLDPFRGFLDELEMFNRVLQPNEVRALWLADRAGKCKVKCAIPQIVAFLPGQECITVLARIANCTAIPQTVQWSATGAMPIPTPAGILVIPPYTTLAVPVVLCRPANQPDGTALTWNFSVESEGRCPVDCVGSIRFPSRPITVDVPEDPVAIRGTSATENITIGLGGLPPGLMLRFTAFGPDMMPDMDTISINGLPPGDPWDFGGIAASRARPAAEGDVEVPIQFVIKDPSSTYTILVQGDLDGDGTLEDLTSFEVENPAVNPPVVSVTVDLLGVTIDWTDDGDGLGILQGAINPEGPWISIPEALPGYRPDPDSPVRFFRVVLGEAEE